MGNQLAPILFPLEPLCPHLRAPGVACLLLFKAPAANFKSGSSPFPSQLPPPRGGIKHRRVIFKTSSSPQDWHQGVVGSATYHPKQGFVLHQKKGEGQ